MKIRITSLDVLQVVSITASGWAYTALFRILVTLPIAWILFYAIYVILTVTLLIKTRKYLEKHNEQITPFWRLVLPLAWPILIARALLFTLFDSPVQLGAVVTGKPSPK